MTIYEFGHPGDEAEILDLANYAFSRHRFHDFRALLPKVYGPGKQYASMHLVARKNGKICGLIATLQQEVRIANESTLKTGYIGTVCVHPYMQGEGHMTTLMKMTLDNARSLGLDMLILGGQRQRYGYAGFECGGTRIVFAINRHNVTHALKSVQASGLQLIEVKRDDNASIDACHTLYEKQLISGLRQRNQFHEIMQSWDGKLFLVKKGNTPAGYIYACGNNIEEMVLEAESMLQEAIKSWYSHCGEAEFNIAAPVYLPARISGLQAFSEGYQIMDAEMLLVLNWKKVIETLLVLKSRYSKLADGRMIIDIEDNCRVSVTVADNRVCVMPSEEMPQMRLSPMAAVTKLFSPIANYTNPPVCHYNWFPLPYFTQMADQF